jgi:quinol monooxygenase YgiN
MTVKYGLLATLEAKPGRADDLAGFLKAGRDIAVAETATVTWYAFRVSENVFGVFDTFDDEAGRQAHLDGQIPVALGQVGPDLLARDPVIQPIDVVAVK